MRSWCVHAPGQPASGTKSAVRAGRAPTHAEAAEPSTNDRQPDDTDGRLGKDREDEEETGTRDREGGDRPVEVGDRTEITGKEDIGWLEFRRAKTEGVRSGRVRRGGVIRGSATPIRRRRAGEGSRAARQGAGRAWQGTRRARRLRGRRRGGRVAGRRRYGEARRRDRRQRRQADGRARKRAEARGRQRR